MLQKITSKKVELPPIYLVENDEDLAQLPKGIPYVIAKKEELSFITIYLEFQTLLRSCLKTNMPIKWLDCLRRIGYNQTQIKTYTLSSGGDYGANKGTGYELPIESFIEDQYLVNFDKLAELKILPKWLDDLRASVETNIIDEVMFDPTAFNKQLGLNIGASAVKHNMKNLLILDISSSMPKGVVQTITSLAKLMSKKFFADVILTGKESILVDYDDVPNFDIIKTTSKIGGGNEGPMFQAIMKQTKHYHTAISFGDDDSPGIYRKGEDDEYSNFKVEILYSLHTENRSNNITGYSKHFQPKETYKVKDWISTIQ